MPHTCLPWVCHVMADVSVCGRPSWWCLAVMSFGILHFLYSFNTFSFFIFVSYRSWYFVVAATLKMVMPLAETSNFQKLLFFLLKVNIGVKWAEKITIGADHLTLEGGGWVILKTNFLQALVGRENCMQPKWNRKKEHLERKKISCTSDS